MEMQLNHADGYEFTIKRKDDRWWIGPFPYHDYEVENYINNGVWKKIKMKSERNISISINSAYAAAKWEYENNNHGRRFQEILYSINKAIEEVYEKAMKQDVFEHTYIGSCSWQVQFQPCDENYGIIEVLTDVSCGMPIHYIDVEDYLSTAN
jgi:hypothetical protein